MPLSTHPPALPRNTVLRLSPWLIVGCAVILGLAITFWAVKNARQERENMTRTFMERSIALIWALEGGVRAGMGMRVSASHLQYLLEETAKQPGIVFMAVVNPQGRILAHSDRKRVGDELYGSTAIAELAPAREPQSRVVRQETDEEGEGTKEIFEVYKIFSPLPGFRDHMRRGMGHGSGRHGGGHREMNGYPRNCPYQPYEAAANGSVAVFGRGLSLEESLDPIILVGFDMRPAEESLATVQRHTLFTALLVGLLGVGGLLSLFWAQSYKLSRRLLQDTRAFAAEVVSSLPLGLVIFDASQRVSQTNAVAESILGLPARELLGKSPGQLAGMDWRALVEKLRQGNGVLEEEHSLTLPGESPARTLPVSVSASRILNDEGTSLGTLFLLRDLREMKLLQEQLRRSERLSTLGNMAARVAHEIRNPLSSIKGFATYLASRQQDEHDSQAAATMIGEVDRLNRVVSELLDFARPSNLRIAPAPLNVILQRALRLVELDAKAKGVSLRFTPADPSPVVAVDAERITQTLLNLFINAVQATPAGGSLSVSTLPVRDSLAGIEIRDTGSGIPEAILNQIANPYFTTKASGSGLGLAIVQKIVEDHGAKISVASREGQGTSVTLRLPLAE